MSSISWKEPVSFLSILAPPMAWVPNKYIGKATTKPVLIESVQQQKCFQGGHFEKDMYSALKLYLDRTVL